MKTFLQILLALIVILTIIYFLGPKPDAPKFESQTFSFPNLLTDLEKQIASEENQIKGLKADNQARILWADTAKKEKTKIALLYVHGFSATQEEGDPVISNLAKKFGANVFLTRLAEHGIDLGDETFRTLTADQLINSAEKSLVIAKQLGEEVVVIGTSMGGALTIYLASKHPEIKSIVLYSPCIKIFDPTAEILDNHWGLQIAKKVTGKEFNDIIPPNNIQPKYWTMHYRLEGLVALQNFLTHAMNNETFAKVKCPVFMGYYYKNEEEQDKVVSVPAMIEMFEKLGSNTKEKKSFPEAANHVLASYVLSKDFQNVEKETERFLRDVVKL